MRVSYLTALLALLATNGCQLVFGYDEFTEDTSGDGDGDGEAGASGDGDGDGDGDNGPCSEEAPPNNSGTKLLPTARDDGSCFWMDEHEVTRGQYRDFANSNPPKLSTPCSWNEEFVDTECEDDSIRITFEDDHPQTCLDQCDAESYCQSVGKTLCRSSYVGTASKDDWQAVCSNGGEDPLPYGGSPNLEACNVQGRGNETTTAVKTNTSCENQDKIRDLVGNVSEWVGGDSCQLNAGAEDLCSAKGGSFTSSLQKATCESARNVARDTRTDDLGFRCCNYTDD